MIRASWLRAFTVAACVVCPPLVSQAQAAPPLGLQVDVGVPDFAGLSVAYRPLSMLRVHGAFLFNGVGPGVRGGVTLVPLSGLFVSPSLSVELGRYFSADGSRALAALGLPTHGLEPVLRNLSYEFASAHVGVEVGPQERFSVFLRAGLSYLNTTITGFGASLQQVVGDPSLQVGDLHVRGILPSMKLGLVFFFFG